MSVALRRITPAVVQSLQVFVQVVLYAGLFIFAQYLVSWLHLPLPANLVGMILMLALIVCRIIPLQWVRAGARWLLAECCCFCSCRGGGGELCTTIAGGWLAYFCSDRVEHGDGIGHDRLGSGKSLSL